MSNIQTIFVHFCVAAKIQPIQFLVQLVNIRLEVKCYAVIALKGFIVQ